MFDIALPSMYEGNFAPDAVSLCGRQDEHHIGGLSLLLPLVLFFADQPRYARQTGLEHLGLTHGGPLMQRSGALVIDLILELIDGVPVLGALLGAASGPEARPLSWRSGLKSQPPAIF